MAIRFTPNPIQERAEREPNQREGKPQLEQQTEDAAPFDRKTYQRAYMREYMRKRRAKTVAT